MYWKSYGKSRMNTSSKWKHTCKYIVEQKTVVKIKQKNFKLDLYCSFWMGPFVVVAHDHWQGVSFPGMMQGLDQFKLDSWNNFILNYKNLLHPFKWSWFDLSWVLRPNNTEMLYGDVDLGLKSRPNDWWNGGIEPATPGLVVQCVIHYTTGPLLTRTHIARLV